MLNNERYNVALNSLGTLIENEKVLSSREENRSLLLDEQYRTQIALTKLGVNYTTSPRQVPMIDQLILGPKTKGQHTFISLIGMPNVGKTSTMIDLGTHEPDEYWLFGDAARRSFGHLKTNESLDFSRLTTTQALIRSRADISYALDSIWFHSMLGEEIPEMRIIFERDINDIAFFRANFLFGRIDAKTLSKVQEAFLEELDKYRGLDRTIVNCLVSRQTSLNRETEKRKHLVVQEPFLTVLYEQYLRFHWEVLNFEKVYGMKPPFNYIAVDLSASSPEENIKHLKKIITQTTGTNRLFIQDPLL